MPACSVAKPTTAAEFLTGLEECAAPYYLFTEAGIEVEMANPTGGPSPIDAGSMGEGFFTEASKKFMHDSAAFGMFSHQKKLADVDPTAYDAIYLSGGHGTCTDFVDNPALKAAIEKCLAGGKVVAADCHGPIALAQCVKPDGTPLVAGMCVTGFNNSEEAAVQQTGNVPFLIETKFTELGAKYEKGDDCEHSPAADNSMATPHERPRLAEPPALPPSKRLLCLARVLRVPPPSSACSCRPTRLASHCASLQNTGTSKCCVDGNLVTGQNPQSSEECAKAVLAKLV